MELSLHSLNELDDTRGRDAGCFGVAVAVHLLLLLWNPIMLRSDFHPTHDFVTVDVVDASPGAGGSAPSPAPKSLMSTLKDMLMKPQVEEIAHTAPEAPAHEVAAPVRPSLTEKTMPHMIAQQFQPNSHAEDLAMSKSPDTISTNDRALPSLPANTPTLTSKSFSGIKSRDLPFQVGGNDAIAGGDVVPIAVGHTSAKAALGYAAPTLKDAGKRSGALSSPIGMGSVGETASMGAGSARTIDISGTGGSGNAPTGSPSGSVLQDRKGTGGGFGGGRGYGTGSGNGFGSGSGFGTQGMPSAAQALDNQLAAGGAGNKIGKKSGKGFDIAGPLGNRGIAHKVIPEYPAWAEEQGIIGSVRLYFTVTPDGSVRPNIRVTKTTGYPQLDQLGIDALKQWRFAPMAGGDDEGGQWGIITFNFSLSS